MGLDLQRRTLSDQLYELLKEDIITHRIGFGEKLSNRELQKKYNVSSTPVRDAVNRLYMDGLIEEINNAGAKVIRFDLSFALEVNEVVSMLNCAALRRCIGLSVNGAPNMRARLDRLMALQQSSLLGEEYIKLDGQFHNIFFEYCGNSQLVTMNNRYHVLRDMLVRRFYVFKESQQESVAQHQSILDAFYAGDPDRSVGLMEKHYSDASAFLEEHMAE